MNDSDAQNTFYNYLNSMEKIENSQYLNFNYYTTDEFRKLCDSITDNVELSIFHLNIRSLKHSQP